MRIVFECIALSLFFALILKFGFISKMLRRYRLLLRKGYIVACFLMIVAPLSGCLFCALYERVLNHDESHILSIAAAYLHGQPMYPAANAPYDYGLLYGPATYFIYIPPMLLGLGKFRDYQLWAAIGLSLSLWITYATLHRKYGDIAATGGTALLGAFVTFQAFYEWAVKGDCWVLLFSAIGFWAAFSLDGMLWVPALLIGITGALLINLKATLVLIAFLPCILLWQRARHARYASVLSGVFILIFAFLPFALPRVSLQAYLQYLLEASRQGISKSMLASNFSIMAGMMAAPLAVFWIAIRQDFSLVVEWLKRRGVYLGLLGASCVAAVATGAKVGAGPWHLMAFAIPLVYTTAEIWNIGIEARSKPAVNVKHYPYPAVAVGIVICLTMFFNFISVIQKHRRYPSDQIQVSMPKVEEGLMEISDQYPHTTLQMGTSDMAHYNLTYTRSILQIRGNPLFIDPNARNEEDLINKPISDEVLAALGNCVIQIWIIPKGDTPFSMDAPYSIKDGRNMKQKSLYSDEFREIFAAHYHEISSSSPYFNLWECNKGK